MTHLCHLRLHTINVENAKQTRQDTPLESPKNKNKHPRSFWQHQALLAAYSSLLLIIMLFYALVIQSLLPVPSALLMRLLRLARPPHCTLAKPCRAFLVVCRRSMLYDAMPEAYSIFKVGPHPHREGTLVSPSDTTQQAAWQQPCLHIEGKLGRKHNLQTLQKQRPTSRQ